MDVRPEMWTKSFMSHLRDCNTICPWPERNKSPPASGFTMNNNNKVSVHPFVYSFGPHLQLKSRLTVNHQGIKTCMTERIRGWKMDWDKRMKEWITERQIGVTNFEQTVWVSVAVIHVIVAK